MDTRWTWQATGGGLLPEARRALGGVDGEVDRLADETAWECAAAREFRWQLAALRGQLDTVRRTADALEDELRDMWQQLTAGAAVG